MTVIEFIFLISVNIFQQRRCKVNLTNDEKMPVLFPDPESATPEGIVAAGGNLEPATLLEAYAKGLFPWYSEGMPILWWSPDPRMVLFPDGLKVSHSLRQTLRAGKYSCRVDTAFPEVIEQCAGVPRHGQEGTWITPEMKKAYIRLHELGYAHSFETYHGEELAGGLYGVSLGAAFFGESMFHLMPDASKVALYHLVQWCKTYRFDFIDAQTPTDHLASLGAREIPRREFLEMLEEAMKKETVRGKWSL